MTRSNLSGGYAGILMILITAAIIAFITWRADLFTPRPTTSDINTGSVPLVGDPTTVQGQINAIPAAESAKQQLEAASNLDSQLNY